MIPISENQPTVGRIVNVIRADAPNTPRMGRVVAVAGDHVTVVVDTPLPSEPALVLNRCQQMRAEEHDDHGIPSSVIRTKVWDPLTMTERERLAWQLVGNDDGMEGFPEHEDLAWAEWMPYQKEQAAKNDDEIRLLRLEVSTLRKALEPTQLRASIAQLRASIGGAELQNDLKDEKTKQMRIELDAVIERVNALFVDFQSILEGSDFDSIGDLLKAIDRTVSELRVTHDRAQAQVLERLSNVEQASAMATMSVALTREMVPQLMQAARALLERQGAGLHDRCEGCGGLFPEEDMEHDVEGVALCPACWDEAELVPEKEDEAQVEESIAQPRPCRIEFTEKGARIRGITESRDTDVLNWIEYPDTKLAIELCNLINDRWASAANDPAIQ